MSNLLTLLRASSSVIGVEPSWQRLEENIWDWYRTFFPNVEIILWSNQESAPQGGIHITTRKLAEAYVPAPQCFEWLTILYYQWGWSEGAEKRICRGFRAMISTHSKSKHAEIDSWCTVTIATREGSREGPSTRFDDDTFRPNLACDSKNKIRW